MRIVFALLLCSTSSIVLNAQNTQLVFEHVTVIDMTGRPPLANQTVVIEQDRIIAVGAFDAIPIPKKAQVVNASGKFLIPGLWDAHAHLAKAGVNGLPLFIANGITSVRDMGGDPEPVLRWRKEVGEGRRLGPRIKMAGPILESVANVRRMKNEGTIEPVERSRAGLGNPSDAKRVVDSIAKLGVDFLKIRSVASLETYQAIAQAARQAKLALTGHVVASPEEILEAGQRSLEHSFFPPLDSLSEMDRKTLFEKFANQDICITPTLISWKESLLVPYGKVAAIVEDEQGELDYRRKYLSGYLIKDWREQIAERKLYPFDLTEMFFGTVRDLRVMHQVGVRFLAGTDVGVVLIYPGFSLHEELQMFVQIIGMTPMQALICATRHPAEFFGMQEELGTIEQGKIADLILLEANPLDNIGNAQKIDAVVVSGKYYPKKVLSKLLTEVEAASR